MQSQARGYNVLDVEISRSAWKGREGQTVRQHVGRFAKLEADTLLQRCVRILRACPGRCIYADMVGRSVAKYRHVFSLQSCLREKARAGLLECYDFMQNQAWGEAQEACNGWPVFVKKEWGDMSPCAKRALEKADIPVFLFKSFPPELSEALVSATTHPVANNVAPEAWAAVPRTPPAEDSRRLPTAMQPCTAGAAAGLVAGVSEVPAAPAAIVSKKGPKSSAAAGPADACSVPAAEARLWQLSASAPSASPQETQSTGSAQAEGEGSERSSEAKDDENPHPSVMVVS